MANNETNSVQLLNSNSVRAVMLLLASCNRLRQNEQRQGRGVSACLFTDCVYLSRDCFDN